MNRFYGFVKIFNAQVTKRIVLKMYATTNSLFKSFIVDKDVKVQLACKKDNR